MCSSDLLATLAPDLALRCTPDAAMLVNTPVRLEVVAADAAGPRVWSITARDGAVVAEPDAGGGGPIADDPACVRVSFPTFLRLVGGVTTLAAAVAAGRAETTGAAPVIDSVARRLPESEDRRSVPPAE